MDNNIQVKEELVENFNRPLPTTKRPPPSKPITVIDLDSSDSDSDVSSSDSSDDGDGVLGINGKRSRVPPGGGEGSAAKKMKKRTFDDLGASLPVGFLDPLPSTPKAAAVRRPIGDENGTAGVQGCRQFWKAGDYEGISSGDWERSSDGMDHVRVHPKFLHSNATSHKWVLGAFAELLDNSLDEVCNGAKYVNIDMLTNRKDGSRMLLIEDNGGGMDPEKMRHCMSLGYSVKSKIADTIGQYGNGFKTSTMRLGADVIVFSRFSGKDGKRPTQSIGLLSYTFLTSTGKEDIIVPMVDYERVRQEWNKLIRSSASDWNKNVETIVQWSPFSSEADLLQQFNQMKEQGTRIVIYNLWEDDQGKLELDFDVDRHDIQIRGVNRDEKKIQMAKHHPNSRHFLTYRHSLRSYASILYLRIPPGFRIILRGKDVEHHNVVNDMMLTQEVTYRPQPGTEGVPKDTNMVAIVTIGFVKDAKAHVDVQGFNVYHKNRLIKPFWRLWNAAGSDGRGVIGVLEANFVEPAHDKQGFERTTVLSRLEGRLIQMQKTYWRTYCHRIGYAPRRHKNDLDDDDRESSPDYLPQPSPQSKGKKASSSKFKPSGSDKFNSISNQKEGRRESGMHSETKNKIHGNGNVYSKAGKNFAKSGKVQSDSEPSSPSAEDASDDYMPGDLLPKGHANGSLQKAFPSNKPPGKDGIGTTASTMPLGHTKGKQNCTSNEKPQDDVNGSECSPSSSPSQVLEKLKEENHELRERLKKRDEEVLGDTLRDLQDEREKCKLLENQLLEATRKIDDMNKEQESLIDIFSEERERRDIEEENLRKKLKEASNTIQELLDKVRLLEKMRSPNSRLDR